MKIQNSDICFIACDFDNVKNMDFQIEIFKNAIPNDHFFAI